MKKKEKKNSIAVPKAGLFNYFVPFHLIRFFKDLKIYKGRMKSFKEKGYSDTAEFETFNWFIDVMKPILTYYRDHRTGTPYILEDENIILNNDEQTERNEAFYNSVLSKMLDLLEKMDENNYNYKELDFKEIYEKQEEAKNEFFELFSKYFYALWD